MRVRVKFFSSFANLAGTNGEELELPEGVTLRDVIRAVLERYPALRQFEPYMIASLNNRVAEGDTAVRDGDTVGIMPPLGGG